MKRFLASILISVGAFSTPPIAMLGIKIGDLEQSLEKIKLEVVAKDTNMIKYRTANGNDFSVTSDSGKILFMENDWLQSLKGKQPLFSDFQFGVTSLKDIRDKFQTNGFSYKERGAFKTETDLIQFNCFEFDSQNNEVLVLITKVPLKAKVTIDNIAELAKLDAIIIADKSYLDENWGREKIFDPNYKKIKP